MGAYHKTVYRWCYLAPFELTQTQTQNQVNSSQLKPSPAKSSQANKARQAKSTYSTSNHVKSSQVKTIPVKSNPLKSSRVKLNQVGPNQVKTARPAATEYDLHTIVFGYKFTWEFSSSHFCLALCDLGGPHGKLSRGTIVIHSNT